jgi:hypothetical protein
MNSVGFFQFSKLLIAPTSVFIQACWYSVRFPPMVYVSVGVITVGVGITTAINPQATPIGSFMALVGVLGTSYLGIVQGLRSKPLNLTALQMMFAEGPVSGATFILAINLTMF